VLSDLALRFPFAVSLTGFGDLPMARFVEPPLSLVRQPGYELGVRASAQLLNIMQQDLPGTGAMLQLSSEFIVRASCIAPTGHRLAEPYSRRAGHVDRLSM